ncbi:hypothetical protein [Nocardia sp. NPDC055049]
MAEHTAAEQLAAIDIVAALLDTGGTHNARVAASLSTIRRRIEQRSEQDRAVGAAFNPERFVGTPPETIGAAIRAAVEKTGAIITEPIVDAELAEDAPS